VTFIGSDLAARAQKQHFTVRRLESGQRAVEDLVIERADEPLLRAQGDEDLRAVIRRTLWRSAAVSEYGADRGAGCRSRRADAGQPLLPFPRASCRHPTHSAHDGVELAGGDAARSISESWQLMADSRFR
jgi:hypothetical protein